MHLLPAIVSADAMMRADSNLTIVNLKTREQFPVCQSLPVWAHCSWMTGLDVSLLKGGVTWKNGGQTETKGRKCGQKTGHVGRLHKLKLVRKTQRSLSLFFHDNSYFKNKPLNKQQPLQ